MERTLCAGAGRRKPVWLGRRSSHGILCFVMQEVSRLQATGWIGFRISGQIFSEIYPANGNCALGALILTHYVNFMCARTRNARRKPKSFGKTLTYPYHTVKSKVSTGSRINNHRDEGDWLASVLPKPELFWLKCAGLHSRHEENKVMKIFGVYII